MKAFGKMDLYLKKICMIFSFQVDGLNQISKELSHGNDVTLSQSLLAKLAAITDDGEEFVTAMYRSCAFLATSKGNLTIHTSISDIH